LVPKIDFCSSELSSLTLSSLSSAQEVGVGLFLALAILQVIGSGGIADLNRRTQTLLTAINTNNLHGIRTQAKRISTDLAQLDLALQGFSKTIFWFALILLLICLAIIATTAVHPEISLTRSQTFGLLSFLLLLPVITFTISAAWIRYKCSTVRKAIKICEIDVNNMISGK
jgi:membrane protein required for beta-lactamase induction